MASLFITDLKARRASASKERDAMKPLLDEVYDYVIPYRRGIGDTSSSGAAGEKRVNRIFDLTAMNAAFRFPGKLQQDLCPPEEKWFTLELGPIGKRMPDADQTGKELEAISEILGTGVATGEWDTAFPEMASDLLNSTGFMLINEGEDDRWARFCTAPAHELLIEPGPYNDIWGIYWTRKWSLGNIMAEWHDGTFTDEFKKLAAEKPNDEIDVHQDTRWDPKKKKWCFYVWLDKYEAAGFVTTRETFTCPWITPRYFKLPGETWGRGLAMVAMPAIKTTNKVVELTLKAAAIALLGIYTYTPHSQFNPDTARIEPGQFWPVASNGGVLGPGIQKFEAPRIDLSNIMLNELRGQIQATLLDQALPPDGAAVRSATEIIERVKQLTSNESGAYGRLIMEIVVPVVRRLIEIAWNKKLIPQRIPIDQLLIRVRVTSPMAAARRAKAVERVIQFLAMGLQVAPQVMQLIIDQEALLLELAAAFGVERKFIRDETNREGIKAQVQALIAQALAAQQAQAAAAAPPPQAAPVPAAA
jgi:hypothetical protein